MSCFEINFLDLDFIRTSTCNKIWHLSEVTFLFSSTPLYSRGDWKIEILSALWQGLEMEILGLVWISIALLMISLYYVIEEKNARKNIVNDKVLMRRVFLGTFKILELFA